MRKILLLMLLSYPCLSFSQLELSPRSQFLIYNQESLNAVHWFEAADLMAKIPFQLSPVIVAVIDSGVSMLHPFLIPQLLTKDLNNESYGYDFVNKRDFMVDDNGHGSHVAGIIVGMNPQAKILPLKVLAASGNGNIDDVTAAIRYAVDKGAKVINLSLGAIDLLGQNKMAYEAAIAWARLHGVLVVAAAGNSASDNDRFSFFPSGVWQDNVLSICATDSQNNLADFSNYGNWRVHLCAPGVNIVSAHHLFREGLWVSLSGTSQASPIISAAASILFSINPTLKPYQVRDKLMETSTSIEKLKGFSQTGGVLNLHKAIEHSF